MAETVTPVVYGGRARWVTALVLHATGATLTAVVFGAALGAIGGALDAPWARAGAILIASTALTYGANELPGVRVAIPQLRRQVPDWWRTFFGWPVAAVLYGAGLGIGFFTYLGHGTIVTVVLGAAASGRPALGAAIVGPFGLLRGISPVVSAGLRTVDEQRALIDKLAGGANGRRAAANGIALLTVAALAIAAATPQHGGWVGLSGAVLAVVFAWAASSKLLGRRRWRRALAAHALPAGLARVAVPAVPAAEALVPALALTGYARASGVWALTLLVVFTGETIRGRLAGGRQMPCGCFGGRGTVGVTAQLVRNAVVGLLAAAVAVGGPFAPVLVAPRLPGHGDLLPMMLATGGLTVAGFTAWRATVWLGRGARA